VLAARYAKEYSQPKPTMLPIMAREILWKSRPFRGKMRKMKTALKNKMGMETREKPKNTHGKA